MVGAKRGGPGPKHFLPGRTRSGFSAGHPSSRRSRAARRRRPFERLSADERLRSSRPRIRARTVDFNAGRFARSRGDARILKGHPGSGKTTALLHAADESQAERVLYLTFSGDLAALARDYFDRFCSDARSFTVLTYPLWIAQLTGRRGNEPDLAGARAQFRKDLLSHQRSLGPWSNDIDGLYDEMHAHLVGAAIPEKSGRFP